MGVISRVGYPPKLHPWILPVCSADFPRKNGKMRVSGRVCWYVACYDFVLGFNVSSLVLMIFQVGFWGSF